MNYRTARRGFTLIELLVVIAIIAILTATTMPMIPALNDQARVTTCEAHLQQIGVALRLYAEDYQAYPATLEPLLTGGYVEQRAVLRCDRADGEYYYRPVPLTAGPDAVVVACTPPGTPAGRRAHRHRTASVVLHRHGGTSLER